MLLCNIPNKMSNRSSECASDRAKKLKQNNSLLTSDPHLLLPIHLGNGGVGRWPLSEFSLLKEAHNGCVKSLRGRVPLGDRFFLSVKFPLR